MSLGRNILANYLSQFYVALIGIVMVPLYIKYMGAEAYGLVGFFAMLQAWFAILDMGLSPTITRQTARFQAGTTDALYFRRLVRALEGIFCLISVVGGGFLFSISHFIARDWLQASKLPLAEVIVSIQLMAIVIALRWICGLYRAVISGSEKLVWLSCFNSITASLRFVVILPVLVFLGATPSVFFGYQCVVALIEFAVLIYYAYRLLPDLPEGEGLPCDWNALRPTMRFSLSAAFTSMVWVLVTQIDKLILSSILPLEEYGYFTLAVVLASGIIMSSGPISSAIIPRLARMEAQGDQEGIIAIYRQATQLISVTSGSISVFIAYCAEPLLFLWTGSREIAKYSSHILILYALGNGIMVLAAFPYYLQYAKGDLRLHVIGNVAFVVLLIPSVIWGAKNFGAIGTGYVWVTLNCIAFMVWLPYVHNKLAPGLNFKWYVKDILIILTPCVIIGYYVRAIIDYNSNGVMMLIELLTVGAILIITAAAFSTSVWNIGRKFKYNSGNRKPS